MAAPARSEATRERRRAILEAALAELLARGYDAVTMEQVRRRSGASIGSIYHHFAGKQELAAALLLEGLAAYQAGFAAALESRRGARAAIEAALRFHLAFVAEHPDRARFLFAEQPAEVSRACEERLRRMNRGFLGRVLRRLHGFAAAGALRPLPADVYAALLVGPAQFFARHWLAGATETPIEEAARRLAQATWAALAPRKET
jgi:AcrR family transcriptional regulator